MAGRLVAGMDLGSTGMKLLIHDDDGAEPVSYTHLTLPTKA